METIYTVEFTQSEMSVLIAGMEAGIEQAVAAQSEEGSAEVLMLFCKIRQKIINSGFISQ